MAYNSEAFVKTGGNKNEAVDIINQTRVTNGATTALIGSELLRNC